MPVTSVFSFYNIVSRAYLLKILWARLNSLPNHRILALTKFKAYVDDKFNVAKILICIFDRAENTVEKGENAGYQHFLLFPQWFWKVLWFKVVKSWDCVGKTTLCIFDRAENTVEKGENAGYQHFLLFPQWFWKVLWFKVVKSWDCVGKTTLSQTTNFRLFQIERVCRWQFQILWKQQKVFETGQKHCGKRRNCSLQAISPFPTVFSKDLCCRHVKTRACLEKG